MGVRAACTGPSHDAAHIGEGLFWYLLESNALVGYQQLSFGESMCFVQDPKQLAPEAMSADR